MEEAAKRGEILRRFSCLLLFTGIAVADSEICMNVLGDLAVVGEEEKDDMEEEMSSSPLEPRHLRGKRCSSTPRWTLELVNEIPS